MPHQCTNCGRTFDDGSKEMLSGCPDCGGNKFQFRPAGSGRSDPDASSDAAGPADAAGEASVSSNPSKTSASAQAPPEQEGSADADDPDAGGPFVGDDRTAESDEAVGAADEDEAQRDARSSVASTDELDRAREMMAEAARERLSEVGDEESVDEGAESIDSGSDDQSEESAESDPDLAALRRELNDQFESIRIVEPGQYELNLMELYDRQEYIISLREDGRYVIEVPDTWRDE